MNSTYQTRRPGARRPVHASLIGSAALALIALGVSVPSLAQAEIHMAYSVEQMCAEGDIVVVGKLLAASSAEIPRKGAGGKDVMVLAQLEVERYLKGDSEATTISFAVDSVGQRTIEQLVADGKTPRVLVFLDQTEQGFGHGGQSYNKWTFHEATTAPWIIDLDGLPAMEVLLAEGFAQPDDADVVLGRCSDVVTKQAEAPEDTDTTKLRSLECPWESEAHGALYGGSSTYLYAPAFLFPAQPE